MPLEGSAMLRTLDRRTGGRSPLSVSPLTHRARPNADRNDGYDLSETPDPCHLHVGDRGPPFPVRRSLPGPPISALPQAGMSHAFLTPAMAMAEKGLEPTF